MNLKIYTPAVTIFNENEELDFEGNKEIIEHLIEGGVDGIAPLGSTGEFTTLTLDEKKELIKLYVDTVDQRVDLIPGCGAISYEETYELSKYALSLGVKGVLIIPPYYYEATQEDIYTYFDKLASNLDGDIYIYNFMERSGFNISTETLMRLVEKHKNIKGIKDTTTTISHTREILSKVKELREDFEVYSGFDDQFTFNALSGGNGCIAALSNIKPNLWSDWVKAMNEENFVEVKKINKKINTLMELYSITNNFPQLFKKIMKENGLNIKTYSKFPFNSVDEAMVRRGLEIIKEIE